ncbi:MAG: DUF58 domain-containing protein [Verrucomicrobiae bacterium]|nr:DUF58 domain-containing protein [Verrucomicrobiae bacterium]
MNFVPSLKMMRMTAAIVVPAAGFGLFLQDSGALLLFLIALFVLVAVTDLWMSLDRLTGIGISGPAMARLLRDRPGTIELCLDRPVGPGLTRLRLALPLLEGLQYPHHEMTILLPEGATLYRVLWDCLPVKRGDYPLEACHLEADSRLGLWQIRDRRPLASQVRVYPNIQQEARATAALFMNRGLHGIHALRKAGKGREFEKIRDYVHGDNYADIHWKATAKRNRPVTKVFQIERTQEVYAVVDFSRLSARACESGRRTGSPHTLAGPGVVGAGESESETYLERFINSALVLGMAAQQQGDHFGLATFSDRTHRVLTARSGRGHFNSCRDMLYGLFPQTVTPDFEEVFATLQLKLRKRALLVFLTNLDDPLLSEHFINSIEGLVRKHLILVVTLRPKGCRPVFSPGTIRTPGDVYEALGGHMQWHALAETERILQHKGVHFLQTDDESLAVGLVAGYLNIKRRQLL